MDGLPINGLRHAPEPGPSGWDDPGRSFARMSSADDDFTKWFGAKAAEFLGFDPSQLPAGDPSELVIDSDRSAVAAG
jgi:hypothetical protein